MHASLELQSGTCCRNLGGSNLPYFQLPTNLPTYLARTFLERLAEILYSSIGVPIADD
jgi:hypothetical protein